jgi:hypothetical protein
MMSMIPIRISLIEECAANEATEIRVLNVRWKKYYFPSFFLTEIHLCLAVGDSIIKKGGLGSH